MDVFGNLSVSAKISASVVVVVNLQAKVGPRNYVGLLTCECCYCENMDEHSKHLLGLGERGRDQEKVSASL